MGPEVSIAVFSYYPILIPAYFMLCAYSPTHLSSFLSLHLIFTLTLLRFALHTVFSLSFYPWEILDSTLVFSVDFH